MHSMNHQLVRSCSILVLVTVFGRTTGEAPSLRLGIRANESRLTRSNYRRAPHTHSRGIRISSSQGTQPSRQPPRGAIGNAATRQGEQPAV